MTRTRTCTLLALAAAALLAACESTPLPPQTAAPVETRSVTPATGAAAAAPGGATAAATPQSRVATVDLAAAGGAAGGSLAARNAAAAALAQRVVYFDFDSYVIKDEFKPVIDSHAKALVASKERRLTIEGHTDERGGREYNLALGQKRAESVARALALLGATEQQVEAVSFGKERPVDTASNEAAWAKNRRAELKDR